MKSHGIQRKYVSHMFLYRFPYSAKKPFKNINLNICSANNTLIFYRIEVPFVEEEILVQSSSYVV